VQVNVDRGLWGPPHRGGPDGERDKALELVGGKMKTKRIKTALQSSAIWLILLLFLFPIYWLVSSSFKQVSDIFVTPPKLFYFKATLLNYQAAFATGRLYFYIANSLIVCSLTVFLSLVLSVPAAYALSRFDSKKKSRLSFWIISIRMGPPIAVIVPLFIILTKIGLLDTRLSLIVVYLMFNIPLGVWMMRGYISMIPTEIDDAAKVEGCGSFRVLTTIIVPLARSGLLTTAIMNFIFSWNEFFFAFILTAQRARTVPVGIEGYIVQTGIRWGEFTAAGSFVLAPILIISLFVSRQFVKGLMAGVLK
jgi:multiple sugar transport system permease protein